MFSYLNLTNVNDNCAGLLEFGRAAHVRLSTCSQRQEGEKVGWLLLVLRLLGRPINSVVSESVLEGFLLGVDWLFSLTY